MKFFYILFVLLILKSLFCVNIENEKDQIIKIEKVLEKLTLKTINYELILNDIKLIIENLQIFSFYYNITKLENSKQCLENITFVLLYDIDIYKNNNSYFEKESISNKKHCYTYLYYKSICFIFQSDNTMTYDLNTQNLINIAYNIWFDKFKVFQNIIIENDIKIKDFFQNSLLNILDRILDSYPISIYETYYSNLIQYISGRCFEIKLPQFNITHIIIKGILYQNITKNISLNEYNLNNVTIFFEYKTEKKISNLKVIEITYIKFTKYEFIFGTIKKGKEFEFIIKQIFLISKQIILKI